MTLRIGSLAAFVTVVVAANLTTSALGVVAWLGIAATAGTWLAGFAFVARDSVHDALGVRWVVVCILAGALVSAAFSPSLALASAVAFLLSETADLVVYTPLRQRGYLRASLTSNATGSVVDSALFLTLAGFPLSLLWGQVAIKLATTTAFVLAVQGVRRAVLRQPNGGGGGRHA